MLREQLQDSKDAPFDEERNEPLTESVRIKGRKLWQCQKSLTRKMAESYKSYRYEDESCLAHTQHAQHAQHTQHTQHARNAQRVSTHWTHRTPKTPSTHRTPITHNKLAHTEHYVCTAPAKTLSVQKIEERPTGKITLKWLKYKREKARDLVQSHYIREENTQNDLDNQFRQQTTKPSETATICRNLPRTTKDDTHARSTTNR